MDLLTLGAAEEWFPFATKPDGGKVEFLLLMLDAEEQRRIDRDALGATTTVQLRGAVQEIAITRERAYRQELYTSVRMLRDSRGGASIKVGNVEARDFLRRELSDQSIEVGASVVLDGRWSDALRQHVLSESAPLRQWCVKRLREAQAQAIEDEQGKGETSPTS